MNRLVHVREQSTEERLDVSASQSRLFHEGHDETAAVRTLQFRAFTVPGDETSGNAAGVVQEADGLGDAKMLGIAADLGHSETAFLSEVTPRSERVRFLTPRAEIAFCSHANIASGVVLARHGAEPVVSMTTNAGTVPVDVASDRATLFAVEPLDPGLIDELLEALRLQRIHLDPGLPVALIQGGNPHAPIAVVDGVLAKLDHDANAVLRSQDREGRDGTVPVVHRLTETRFVSRNPFPRGGIREDPATGSAAEREPPVQSGVRGL